MPACRRAIHCCVAGLLTAMLAGCAGWSSWENSHQKPRTVHRQTVPPAASGEYRVQTGDTLYSIAFRNNLDYHDLARWNGIGGDYLIRAGQVLRLSPPAGGAVPATVSRPAVQAPAVVSAPPTVAVPQAAAPSVRPPPVLRPAVMPEPMPELGSYEWTWPTLGGVSRSYAQDGSKGLDIGGQLGQPVFAAAPGRVVYSGNALKGYGELIIIKHDETFLSAYGYNRLRHVKEGDIVTTGQPIGELGLGPENKPMLHFEIREKGQPIDPLRKLPKR